MRDNLVRVNIVLTKKQRERFKRYARRYHGSLSQFLRLAAENEIDESNEYEEMKLRPVIELLEKNGNVIQKISRTIMKVEGDVDIVAEKIAGMNDKVADDIEDLLLNRRGALSIPEIAGYLPCDQEELIRGIERLQETFAVERIGQINAPSKWMIKR